MAKIAIRPIRVEGNVAFISLSQGYEAKIDAADMPLVQNNRWHARVRRLRDGKIGVVYAQAHSGNQKIWLHRVLTVAPDGMAIDHINGDGLDNRRSNLRFAPDGCNQHNARRPTNNKSGFKGVTWDSARLKWRATIALKRKHIHLGRFDNIEAAIAAYARASSEFHGEFGRVA